MSLQPRKREASRRRIVEAAGQAFRKNGLAGIGVDGLAKGAELTSGAFYFHFKSKMEVFVASLEHALEDLRTGIAYFQQENPEHWLSGFAAYYLGFKRTCDLTEGCSLPVLTPEVERAGHDAQQVFQAKLAEIIDLVAGGLTADGSSSRRDRSIVLLALLSGGVNLARAVEDKALSEEIAAAVLKAAQALEHFQ